MHAANAHGVVRVAVTQLASSRPSQSPRKVTRPTFRCVCRPFMSLRSRVMCRRNSAAGVALAGVPFPSVSFADRGTSASPRSPRSSHVPSAST